MVSSIKSVLQLEALTSAWLRERLAGTRQHSDPLDVAMPPGSDAWPSALRERLTTTLRVAGVLIPVIERHGTLSILLTQRSADLKHHAGQVSFPGGRKERRDVDITATALRETHEEVGIEPHHVSVIGYLAPMPTTTGYAVSPVVGIVGDGAELAIDRTEVEFTFEVPLEFLLDETNDRRVERRLYGCSIPMVEFQYDGQRIWGATAQMLLTLRKFLI